MKKIIYIFGNNGIGKSFQIRKYIRQFKDVKYEKPFTIINDNIFILGKYDDKLKYPGADCFSNKKFDVVNKAILEHNKGMLIVDMSVISFPKLAEAYNSNDDILFVSATLDLYTNIQYINNRTGISDKKILNLIQKYKYQTKCYKKLVKSGANVQEMNISDVPELLNKMGKDFL